MKLSPTTNAGLAHLFLRGLREKHAVNDATVLINDADHLYTPLSLLGLRFQIRHHRTRDSAEYVFCKLKRQTPWFSATFIHVEPTTAEA